MEDLDLVGRALGAAETVEDSATTGRAAVLVVDVEEAPGDADPGSEVHRATDVEDHPRKRWLVLALPIMSWTQFSADRNRVGVALLLKITLSLYSRIPPSSASRCFSAYP